MRIVVAGPETLSGSTLALNLKAAEHDIVLTRTAADALATVTRTEAGAVIVGAALPDMDRVTFCRELRARRHAGPILVLGDLSATAATFQAVDHRRRAGDYVVISEEPMKVAAPALGRRRQRASIS